MVNATLLAGQFLADLASQQDILPETTSGREGLIFASGITGSDTVVRISLGLMDFELKGLREKRRRLRERCRRLESSTSLSCVKIKFTKAYRNMRYWLKDSPHVVEYAREAYQRCNISPNEVSVRACGDGTVLTERGLPTPYIFCGPQNTHSYLEWVSLQDMEQSVEVLTSLVQIWEEKAH